MAATANEILADLILQNHLQLQRLASHEYQKMLKILTELAKELVKQMITIDPTAPGHLRYRNERAAKLMSKSQRKISKYFAEMLREFRSDMYELATLEANFAVNSLSSVTGIAISRAMTAEQMRAVVNSTYIEGGLLKDWFSRASQGYMLAFRKEIRAGMVAGEGIDKMIRRIIGSKREFPGDPSLYDKQKRGTEALVRTAVMSISNEARMAAFRANEDVIKGYQWLATLDDVTCLVCAVYDLKIWDTKANPIGHDKEFKISPIHWNCRCVITPLTTIDEERLARKQEGMGRSSQYGRVSRSMNFEKWLESMPPEKQQQIIKNNIGKNRYEAWKEGKITFNDLITQKGRPLTLEELRADMNMGGSATSATGAKGAIPNNVSNDD